jgi:hypothetical protein
MMLGISENWPTEKGPSDVITPAVAPNPAACIRDDRCKENEVFRRRDGTSEDTSSSGAPSAVGSVHRLETSHKVLSCVRRDANWPAPLRIATRFHKQQRFGRRATF